MMKKDLISFSFATNCQRSTSILLSRLCLEGFHDSCFSSSYYHLSRVIWLDFLFIFGRLVWY